MRSNSLSGTRPASTSASVPRLTAPNSARTRTSSGGRRRQRFRADLGLSGRAIPERLGHLVGPADRHFTLSPDWTLRRFAVLYHRVRNDRPGIRSRNRVLDRSPPQAMQADAAGNVMFGRRVLFAVLFAATMAGSLALAALALTPGGLGLIDVTLLALFAVTLPWMVAGFWNAVIGFLIMRFSADPTAAVMPMAARYPRRRTDDGVDRDPVVHPQRIAGAGDPQLEPMLAGLDAAGCGACFHLYVLSDTSDAEIAGNEELCFAALASRWRGRIAVTYRRRALNTGYKAGNIRDFCERWGAQPRFRGDARRRQSHDRRRDSASGSHHAGRSQARHPAGAGRRPALHQRLRAHLSVRHAARHALLHHRQRLVAGRLRTLLGPQRGTAARAVHRALRASGAVQGRNGGSPYPQSRPDRGRADARGRLRRARAAAGGSGLGGKSADADRVHPPRPALVPGQHAVLALSARCRA